MITKSNTVVSVDTSDKSRSHAAIIVLFLLGFKLNPIRKAILALNQETVVDLADHMGMKRQRIHHYLAGRRIQDKKLMELLAGYFDVPPEIFFPDTYRTPSEDPHRCRNQGLS